MLTFDDLTWSGGTVFDDLDEAAVNAYVHTGNASITLSAEAAQEEMGVYEQGLDVTLVFEPNSAQELLPPSGAVAYQQSGNATAIFFTLTTQEHIPTFAGIDGQTGNAAILFYAGAAQSYLGGAAAGEYLHQADALVTLSAGGAQVWSPIAIGVAGYASLTEIEGYANLTPTVVTITLNQPLDPCSLIELEIESDDSEWTDGVGVKGGPIAIAVDLQDGEEWLPLTSLSKAYSSVQFTSGPAFDALAAAVADGELTLRLGGYEGAADRVLQRHIYGSTTVAVGAYT